MVFISPFSGRLIARFGARRLMTVGWRCGVAGLLVLTRLDAGSPYGLLLAGYLLFGIALGLVYAPMSTAAMAAMPAEKVGIASGVLAMDRVLAGAVALAATGAVFHALLGDGRLASPPRSPARPGSSVGLCAFGAGLTWAFVRDPEPGPDSAVAGEPPCGSSTITAPPALSPLRPITAVRSLDKSESRPVHSDIARPHSRAVFAILEAMPSLSGDELHELSERQDPRLLRALDVVAPGGALREGIDNIVHSRTGGLIVVGDLDDISHLLSGGIKLDVDYTPAMLYQVAKMDGAIVLNAEATKIAWANVQLMPDPTILSSETGTRHRTAERVSKQTTALVVAISQRRDVVSLYVEGTKYILQDIPAVLAKANQGLATLEKYRERLDQVSARLTVLEFEGGGVLHDALSVLQRAELVTRMAVEVERYIVELGTEGRLIEMQLEETMVGVAADKTALIRDYSVEDSEQNLTAVLQALSRMPHQDVLDFGRLAELLGYDRKLNTLDFPVAPRGYRVLGRIPRIPKLVVQKITHELGGLEEVLAASDAELAAVDGVGPTRAKDIREGLRRLQEVDLVDRYLQS